MKFREWKAITLAKLLELRDKYSENAKAVSIIDDVIVKLHTAKLRDMSAILFFFHLASKEIPEISQLVPEQHELEELFKEKQLRKDK